MRVVLLPVRPCYIVPLGLAQAAVTPAFLVHARAWEVVVGVGVVVSVTERVAVPVGVQDWDTATKMTQTISECDAKQTEKHW